MASSPEKIPSEKQSRDIDLFLERLLEIALMQIEQEELDEAEVQIIP